MTRRRPRVWRELPAQLRGEVLRDLVFREACAAGEAESDHRRDMHQLARAYKLAQAELRAAVRRTA